MVIIVPQENENQVLSTLKTTNETVYNIGKIKDNTTGNQVLFQ